MYVQVAIKNYKIHTNTHFKIYCNDACQVFAEVDLPIFTQKWYICGWN